MNIFALPPDAEFGAGVLMLIINVPGSRPEETLEIAFKESSCAEKMVASLGWDILKVLRSSSITAEQPRVAENGP